MRQARRWRFQITRVVLQEQQEFSSGQSERSVGVSPSESVPVFLPFPGTSDTNPQAQTSTGESTLPVISSQWGLDLSIMNYNFSSYDCAPAVSVSSREMRSNPSSDLTQLDLRPLSSYFNLQREGPSRMTATLVTMRGLRV